MAILLYSTCDGYTTYVTMAIRYYGNTLLWLYVTMAIRYYGYTLLWQYFTMAILYYGYTLLWQYFTITITMAIVLAMALLAELKWLYLSGAILAEYLLSRPLARGS